MKHLIFVLAVTLTVNLWSQKEKFDFREEWIPQVKVELSSNNGFGINSAFGFEDYLADFVSFKNFVGVEMNSSRSFLYLAPTYGIDVHFENWGYISRVPMITVRATYSVPFDMHSNKYGMYLTPELGLSLGSIFYITSGYRIPLTKSSPADLKGFKLSVGVDIPIFLD